MREEVADQAVAMAFMHCQGRISARTEYTGSENLGERGNIGFVSRSKFNETCEVGGDRIKSGNIGKTKLAKRVLENGDTSLGGGGGVWGGIYCFHDFVDLRGDKRI